MSMETKVDSAVSAAKQHVWRFHAALENCPASTNAIHHQLNQYAAASDQYCFRSVYPFRDHLTSTYAVADQFWKPLITSFRNLRRRPDIFIASRNALHEEDGSEDDGVWVLSMGHLVGLFDQDWLGIRHTRQMAALRYAEFSHVVWNQNQEPQIVQTGLFLDIVGFMQSVGMNPLPPSTGVHFCYPGPKTHDGIHLHRNAPLKEGRATQDLVDRMIEDLSSINHSFTCDPDLLRKTWHEDMTWYGPSGIGATYTIPRYQEQHQIPFRSQLSDKKFHGHQVRLAEGNYAAFFGWPMNLTNTPLGGFLGMPGGNFKDCPMQVVDVYRRDGDKLSENWVLIDLLWYLKHQGVDLLQRTTGIANPISLVSPTRIEDTKEQLREVFHIQEEKKEEVTSTVDSDDDDRKSADSEGFVHVRRNKAVDEEIDMTQVTHAATVDMSDVLDPKKESSPLLPRKKNMPMDGFDKDFVDIVDYILKITYWIWHEKKVDLCMDYYSTDCLMHTMAGNIQGADTVVANTWSTLDAFPDRTLDGENVVWSREQGIHKEKYSHESPVYYSSHLIVSRMTNDGPSEWGQATNIRARIRTIADCVCTENKIVEEWLMRDNALLVSKLGLDVNEIAKRQALKDKEVGRNLLKELELERARVKENALVLSELPQCNDDIPGLKFGISPINAASREAEARAFAESLFGTLWQNQETDKSALFYDYRVSAHLTAGRELYGTVEMHEYLTQFQTGLSNIAVSIDHIACIPYLGTETFDVAVRWTLTAEHTGDSGVLGTASGAPIYILAGSQFRIMKHRVREEWTVFDELALLRQIETHRLAICEGN